MKAKEFYQKHFRADGRPTIVRDIDNRCFDLLTKAEGQPIIILRGRNRTIYMSKKLKKDDRA